MPYETHQEGLEPADGEPNIGVLWNATMGWFDRRTNQWIPGLRDRTEDNERAMLDIRRDIRRRDYVMGFVALILLADAFGVPTKIVWTAISHLLGGGGL